MVEFESENRWCREFVDDVWGGEEENSFFSSLSFFLLAPASSFILHQVHYRSLFGRLWIFFWESSSFLASAPLISQMPDFRPRVQLRGREEQGVLKESQLILGQSGGVQLATASLVVSRRLAASWLAGFSPLSDVSGPVKDIVRWGVWLGRHIC